MITVNPKTTICAYIDMFTVNPKTTVCAYIDMFAVNPKTTIFTYIDMFAVKALVACSITLIAENEIDSFIVSES